jgi:CHAT domain-containing protein
LHIDRDAAELHTLPWELLREDQTVSNPLSAQKDTPFSRYLASESKWGGPIVERPVRVLTVISNPDDLEETYNLAPVDVASERKNLESAFSTTGVDKLQFEFLDAPVTLERLGNALFDGYHVLHFVGHGVFSQRRGQAALYMQDQEGHAQRVLDEKLAQLLARQGEELRLVFLAACESASRSMADAFQGLGPKLIAAGVPAVVAMQDVVTMETAAKFSVTFYQQLLEHYRVDLAVNEARSALLTAERPDAAVPVLFMRVRDGLLFAPPSDKGSESPEGSSVKVILGTESGTISGSQFQIGDVNIAGGDQVG